MPVGPERGQARRCPGVDPVAPTHCRRRASAFLPHATTVAGLFLLAAASSQPGAARTWQVAPDGTGDASTIQAGIDSSADGDTVLVLPGRYVENIRFWGKQIVLTGSGAEVSIIDGSGSNERPTVEIRDGEGQGTIIEGFTITGGSGNAVVPSGGGILVLDSEPTIRGNTVKENAAERGGTGFGGGIYCSANVSVKSPIIEENVIVENVVGIDGAGIGVDGLVAPVIRNNVIARNTNTHEGDGGGIWLLLSGTPATTIIAGNRVEDNLALDHGGGIYLAETGKDGPQDILVENNWIVGNRAAGVASSPPGGGGIWVGAANAVIRNNTIVGNDSWGGSESFGGGIGIDDDYGSPVIERNIIALSVEGGGIRCSEWAAPVIRNNLVWQNAGGEEGVVCVGWVGRDGNLELDPLFCDPAGGNYSVSSHSPALTAPGGPIGAGAEPGCDLVPVIRTTWGRLKSMYGD